MSPTAAAPRQGAAPGIRARCNAVSSRFVQTLNRRTAVELELRRHVPDRARRRALEARLVVLHEEQAQLEEQLSRLAAQLARDGEDA